MVKTAVIKSYSNLYHYNEKNYCPGCGSTHWLVGRESAECARCDTALPLAEPIHKKFHEPQEKKPFWLFLFDRLMFGV